MSAKGTRPWRSGDDPSVPGRNRTRGCYTRPMHHARRLLSRLADGRVHAGARLATELGIGRDSLRAAVRYLREHGIRVAAEGREGFRLGERLELLDEASILAQLDPESRSVLRGLEVLFEVGSTNARLSELAARGTGAPYACLAEVQSVGRGRRGRAWRSPLARNVYLSLSWRFANRGVPMLGLSPAVAVAVADALEGIGARELALKWPNDLRWRGRKLGGVLLELDPAADKGWHAVIGIGLNVSMPPALVGDIEQPWTDLETVLGHRVSRNEVAARVIERGLDAAGTFAVEGFRAFRPGWARRDEVRGRRVELVGRRQSVAGVAMGLDDEGGLLVAVGDRVERVLSGDLSLSVSQ